MSQEKQQDKKKRKKKVSKAQTISARRRADRARRERKRAKQKRKREEQRAYKFRIKVVRKYRYLKKQMPEKEAIKVVLEKYGPSEDWHFKLSASTVRRWNRLVGADNNYAALRPKSTRPKTIHYQVPALVVGIIFTLRHQLGWGGHRIAAELAGRGIWQLSGKTVYNIFERLGLSVKTYALKGKSDGISYRRYEKKRPNQQWHIDLKQTKLSDGTTVYICILIDDYSRYALAAVAGLNKTSQWVTSVAQQAFVNTGHPDELLSDNGTEFASTWEDSLTQFGKLLADKEIIHRTTAPYYPQANGKAEAFIKILNRELLGHHTFDTLEDLQAVLDRYLLYYNNYRRHSGIGWQIPAARYSGCAISVSGLAQIPGLEAMAANPIFGPSMADPPIPITPLSADRFQAIVPVF
ncbi:MAG: transposase [Chloroflexi bacterium]|nr:transposase [Chloroflexota bacterium]